MLREGGKGGGRGAEGGGNPSSTLAKLLVYQPTSAPCPQTEASSDTLCCPQPEHRAKMTPHGPLSVVNTPPPPAWPEFSEISGMCISLPLPLTIPTLAIISLAWTFLQVLLEFAA